MKRSSYYIGFVGLVTAGFSACTGVVDQAGGTGPGGSSTGSGTIGGTGPGTTPGGAGPGAIPGTVVPGTTVPCTPGVPLTSQLPRLTHAQYDNTIRDLVGLAIQPAFLPSSMLAPDTLGSVDQRVWDGYQAAAASLAPQVMADATARAQTIPCTPTGDGAACAQTFIEQFGRRAFRRPLATDEVTRFKTLYTNRAALTATGTFDEGATLILRAFLLSPSFLTRAEISETADGANFLLNGYEVASRLSYMLWGTMPDEALFTSAAGGKLATSAGILTEAQRMLKDPKARTMVSSFHEHYALMGTATRWSEVSHDPVAFPKFTPAMVPMLTDETKRFFDYITFDLNGTFQDLITKPVAFVNKDLAPLYGLDATKYGTDLVRADLDPAQRAGVFTHAGFLASYSSYNRTSPILRGAFLQKQILCTTIGSPPADAANTPVPTDANLVTNRQRVDQQTSAMACASCHHEIVNPTGFAMEAYDGVGGYQTKERDTGAAIDATADVLIGGKSVHVTGPVDLMTKIAASPEAAGCYAQNWVKYAYERDLTVQDACTAQTLASKMKQAGYTVVSLVTDLTQSQSFRYRAKE